MTLTTSLPGRGRLCSAARNRYELPAIHHKFDERAFSHAGKAAWNNLPPNITAKLIRLLTSVLRPIYLNYLIAYDFIMHLWPQSVEVSHAITNDYAAH